MNAGQFLYQVIKDLDIDNSMGDYNHIAFDFIQSQNLESHFEDYILNFFKPQVKMRGYEDYCEHVGQNGENQETFEYPKFAFNEFLDYYKLGVEEAKREIDEYNENYVNMDPGSV